MLTTKTHKSDNGYGTSNASKSRGYGYATRGYGYKVACVACGWVAVLALTDSASAAPNLTISHNLTSIASGDTFDLGTFETQEQAGEAFVVRNFGNDALVFDDLATPLGAVSGNISDFALNLPQSLAPGGGFGVMTVGFTSAEPGSVSVEVLIHSNDPINEQYHVTLTAQFEEPVVPEMTVLFETTQLQSGDTFDFGEVVAGDTVSEALTIRNFGQGPLAFNNVGGATLTAITGNIANAAVNVVATEIVSGGFGIVGFAFDALDVGTTQVLLTMRTNDPVTPQFEVVLEVTVQEAEVALPSLLVTQVNNPINPDDTYDLGAAELGATIDETFSVRNLGDAVLVLGTLTEEVTIQELTGGEVSDFSVELQEKEIPAPGSTDMTVTFAPTSIGPREMALTIYSNDPTNPEYTFTLLAEGLEAQIAPVAKMRVEKNQIAIDSGDTYDLGETLAGQTISDALAIYNDGDAPLVITSATTEGDAGFEYELQLNEEINAGDPAAMTVAYTGTTAGEYAGTLTMLTNDPQRQAYAITFTATVIDEDVELAPRIQVSVDGDILADAETFDLGAVQAGFTKLQAFTVTNVGNATLHLDAPVQVFELSDGNIDDATATLSTTEIAPDQSATLALAVNVSDTGAREFEVVLDSDDPQTPEYSFFVKVNATTDCNENGIEDDADIANGTSEDCNSDGTPDECEADSDGDGVIDGCDRCPGEDDLSDSDVDGVRDCLDNCPELFNPNQVDADGDGIGDSCDEVIEQENTDPSLACGAGGMAMLPLMMMGLCGMGRRRYGAAADSRA